MSDPASGPIPSGPIPGSLSGAVSSASGSDIAAVFPPRAGRAHEVTGAGMVGFAAIVCGLSNRFDGKPAFWIAQSWRNEGLNPVGLADFCDPACLLLARVKDTAEGLAVAEEALRSGAVATVVMEVAERLGLIAGRRLQLAAEAGGTTGLFLISEGNGSNAAETRWCAAPVFHRQDSTLQRWELIKNKKGTLAGWTVRWDAEAHRIIVVSESGERPGLAAPTARRPLRAHGAAP